MYRFMRGIEKRIAEVESVYESVYVPPTPEELARQDARSEQIVDAILKDLPPEAVSPGLTAEERRIFEQMRRFAPVFWEMLEEGVIDAEGRPAAPLAGHEGGLLDPDDLDDMDQEPLRGP